MPLSASNDGIQNRKDDFFPGTGKKPDELPNGGGKKGKETDNNDKDWSERSPFEPKDFKKKIGSATKNISQSVVSDFVSESVCSFIDSNSEKGFQNTDFSTILTNAFKSSMKTFKLECLKLSMDELLKWLTTAVKGLKFVKGPFQKLSVIWNITSMIKDLINGCMTPWELVNWFFSKAVSFGIDLLITYIFGPVGFVFSTFISIAGNVIKHLINRFIKKLSK